MGLGEAAATEAMPIETEPPRAMPAQGRQRATCYAAGGGSCQGSSRSASGKLKRAPRRESTTTPPRRAPQVCNSGARRYRLSRRRLSHELLNWRRELPGLKPFRQWKMRTLPARASHLAHGAGNKLSLVLRQGRVDLGVCHGRGVGSARGAAQTKAPEVPVYFCTR